MDDESSIVSEISDDIRERISKYNASRPKVVKRLHPFRATILRGLAVLLPPLLTIVILFWIAGTVNNYVIQPVFNFARQSLVLVTATADRVPTKTSLPSNVRTDPLEFKGKVYRLADDKTYVSQYVYDIVDQDAQENFMSVPKTGYEIYERYVEITFLKPYIFIPTLTLLFLVLIYLFGKIIAVSAGRMAWNALEQVVSQVPLVREVYGAVKKVIDMVLSEQEVKFSRVVAIQWPRKGVWALALVTSEGIPAIEKLVGEPVFAVLVPTSPMPATGFTLHVKQSEAIDVGITIDQAIQFIVSCGVVAVGDETDDTIETSIHEKIAGTVVGGD